MQKFLDGADKLVSIGVGAYDGEVEEGGGLEGRSGEVVFGFAFSGWCWSGSGRVGRCEGIGLEVEDVVRHGGGLYGVDVSGC